MKSNIAFYLRNLANDECGVSRYDIAEAREHILLNHPGCPPLAVEYFAAAVAKREWVTPVWGRLWASPC